MAVAATVTANVLFMIALRSIPLRLLTTRSSRPAASTPRENLATRAHCRQGLPPMRRLIPRPQQTSEAGLVGGLLSFRKSS